ncbi:hypothetical protein RJ639_044722 [Escallonia herrerae]|uniref:Uncharacterized protein n=1 Tax=Escallonia herrerae TaxID=1293975 RepID=A0AA88WC90_9ASTE|nr:hypothetical protein RJ639_044722 [Escallonia herrerae]
MAKLEAVEEPAKQQHETNKKIRKKNHGSTELFVFVDYLFLLIFFAFLFFIRCKGMDTIRLKVEVTATDASENGNNETFDEIDESKLHEMLGYLVTNEMKVDFNMLSPRMKYGIYGKAKQFPSSSKVINKYTNNDVKNSPQKQGVDPTVDKLILINPMFIVGVWASVVETEP